MELLASSNVGRDINRGVYGNERIADALQKPVVQALCALIRFRNTHTAFSGEFSLTDYANNTINLINSKATTDKLEDCKHISLLWQNHNAQSEARLELYVAAQQMCISWSSIDGEVAIAQIEEIVAYY